MKNLINKIVAFQDKCPIIDKNKEGYQCTYASYDHVHSVIKPILKEVGLRIVHYSKVDGEQNILTTKLICPETLECTESSVVFNRNDPQDIGKCLTYFKRYNVTLLLDLIIIDEPDLDEDKPESKKEIKRKNPQPKPAAQGKGFS